MESEYTKQAADFLAKAGVVFAAKWIGRDCPPFCEDKAKGIGLAEIGVFPRKTHIHGDHWVCSLRRDLLEHASLYKKEFHIDYWDSYNDAFKNLGLVKLHKGMSGEEWNRAEMCNRQGGQKWIEKAPPTSYDLLACLEKYPIDTFEGFCQDYGYDSDSRRAFQVFKACQNQYQKLSTFFSPDEMIELREIQ